ncbi:MAG: hypothetical protein V1729_01810 [Candidatus Woesearchaeota archaeon]
MKKAQAMSLNVVVLAVLALIILIVLVLIFSGKLKIFSSGTSDTAGQYKSGNCESPATDNRCVSYADDCNGAYSSGNYPDCEAAGHSGCCSM